MTLREYGEIALSELRQAGAEKGSCRIVEREKREFNLESDKLTLLRTTFDTSLRLLAIKGGKRGATSVNRVDRGGISDAAERVMELAEASQPDAANEIAECQPRESFSCGSEKPDTGLMFDRLHEFLISAKKDFPDTIIEQAILDFTSSSGVFVNTNGVDFETRGGHYRFYANFATRRGNRSSSMNGCAFSADSLERPLREYACLERILSQSGEQVDTKPVPEKFTGDILIVPEALSDFLGFLIGSLSDHAMITGTSIYREMLGCQIASPLLTLRADPVSAELVNRSFVTPDGYRAEPLTIMEKGVLKSFLLSLYGSRKTGGRRAANLGGCWILESGSAPFSDLVGTIERGVLVGRFSGGEPGSNGDFSGIAKNSYYIENGKVTFPLSETMISGNMADLFRAVRGVSSERVDFGDALLPWIMAGGITVSGK